MNVTSSLRYVTVLVSLVYLSACKTGWDSDIESSAEPSPTPVPTATPTPSSGSNSSHFSQIIGNECAFAALRYDGSVETWGSEYCGGDSSGVQAELSGVVTIARSKAAFAALTSGGAVVTWGAADYGGRSDDVAAELIDIVELKGNSEGFSALDASGAAIVWGFESPALALDQLQFSAQQGVSGLSQLTASVDAFAAITADGNVIAWGYGAAADNQVVADHLQGVTALSGAFGFSALRDDGAVVQWGTLYSSAAGLLLSDLDMTQIISLHSDESQITPLAEFAGITSNNDVLLWGGPTDEVVQVDELVGAVQLYNSNCLLLAVMADGSVKTHGYEECASDLVLARGAWLEGSLVSPVLVQSNRLGIASLQSDGTALFDVWPDLDEQSFAGIEAIAASPHVIVTQGSSGELQAWGDASRGADLRDLAADLGDISLVVSHKESGALLTSSGSVVVWGEAMSDATELSLATQSMPLTYIVAADYAMAGWSSDGDVVAWGDSDYGGDASAVIANLQNVDEIVAGNRAFAALKSDNTVVTWGDPINGGDSSTVAASLVDVQQLMANRAGAFAAVTGAGNIVTWGNSVSGGDSAAVQSLLIGVTAVYASHQAFAALTAEGKVVLWGSGVAAGEVAGLASAQQIIAADDFFAVLTQAGELVILTESGVDNLNQQLGLTQQFIRAFSNGRAIAVLDTSGKVFTWGDASLGGDSAVVADQLTSVEVVIPNGGAFAAVRSDKTVVTWGGDNFGGDSSAVAGVLSGVVEIKGSSAAFAVLLADGRVVSWGAADAGGDCSSVEHKLTEVIKLNAIAGGFFATRSDGSVVTCGSVPSSSSHNIAVSAP